MSAIARMSAIHGKIGKIAGRPCRFHRTLAERALAERALAERASAPLGGTAVRRL
jgi:hypothetical protein|tara:strand:+ start:164 stop:328 length:165 start_codon:yes stop_codon:yes gene_type:complete